MPDDNIDYRQMYPNRRRKSRTPDVARARRPKEKPDNGFFAPMRKTSRPLNPNTTQYRVKEMLFADPNLTVDEIMQRMGKTSGSAKFTITLLRDSYLHTVDFLIRQGATGVKGRDRRPGRRR